MAKSIILSCGGFTGLDERAGSSAGIKALPRVVNFYVDESGALRKRNGYGVIGTVVGDRDVNAVWHGVLNKKPVTFAACDFDIYRLTEDELNFKLIGQTHNGPKRFFKFGEELYCLGQGLFKITEDKIENVEGYVPLVVTACTPGGIGTVYEQPNMLSDKRRVKFNADGVSITYTLPEKDLTEIVWAKVNGEFLEKSLYTTFFESGAIDFSTPPPEGINNVEVCYAVKENRDLKSLITACRYSAVFENRLFVFGNPAFPDRIYHSELADGLPSAEYFTETAYHAFDKTVTALVPCYNRLLIFFEDSACFTYASLTTDTLGAVYTSFPVYELHGSKGCVLQGVGCAFENTPVTLCRDGLNKWVSTAIADERSAVTFSHRAFRFINNALRHPEHLLLYNRKAKDELWFCSDVGTLIYNYALDCFYIYDLCDIRSMYEDGKDLWLGMTGGRVCLFTEDCVYDGDVPIKAEFESSFCSFGSPYTLKSLNGISLGFCGNHPLNAHVSLKRGNDTENQKEVLTLSLPSLKEDGYRRVKRRLHMKRFFSCKIGFDTEDDFVTVKDLHLFAKELTGGIRIN